MNLSSPEVRKIADDIREMKIRGAGGIARSAVQALLLTAKSSIASDPPELISELQAASQLLLSTRPTAVSLPNGVRYVTGRAISELQKGKNLEDIRAVTIRSAEEFISNSLSAIQRIGEIGAKRISDGDKILTHCNSSAVASILETAWDHGKRFEVTVTETRPRFQGRITARRLASIGIPVTMILDDAARFFMNKLDKYIVGADAITANGALVNKIGTSLIALAAHEARVRVFVAAETYKFSPETLIGELIEIEERDPSEIINATELNQLGNIVVRNPAFDITPPEYIDLIITEKGIISPQAAVLILQQEFGFLTPEDFSEYHAVRISEQD